jgi:hypothetical protein
MREWKISKFLKVAKQYFYCYIYVQLLRQAFQNSHFEIFPYKITPLLRQKLQPSFDEGLLTCCGFRCGIFGFAVDSHLCQIPFNTVVMNLDFPPKFTIRTLDDKKAHFFPKPIFLSTFSCFSKLLIVK